MMIGASLAGHKDLVHIETLGEILGLAFQMRDDLLDIIEIKPNKTIFSDHQGGNQTYILLHMLQKVTSDEKIFVEQTRGKHMSTEEKKKLLSIYIRTGTIEYAKQQINYLLDQATTQLKQIVGKENDYHKYIQRIIDFLRV